MVEPNRIWWSHKTGSDGRIKTDHMVELTGLRKQWTARLLEAAQ